MSLAKTTALAEHVSDACFVAVPHPMGMLPQADIKKKAEDAFAEILKISTGWKPTVAAPLAEAAYPAKRVEFTGNVEGVNKYFLEKGWSLGLPIVPPTPERVHELLGGTSRKPDEVLGQMPPRMGTLTIELIATNAAMAGCEPKHMPVLIAALEALLIPAVNWRGALTTTGTTQFVVIVNGPIVKEIGIGCEQGAAGKGYHANAAIGYAINLIAYTVGGSKSPTIDRSTLGSPSDYVCWVFGENEDSLPSGWEPLHVDRGFKRSDSVVTVMSSYPPLENIDHWSVTLEEHLRWWGHMVNPLHNIGGPSNPIMLEQSPIVAIGPEHAQLIVSGGWSKDDFREVLWDKTRLPLSVWPSQCTGMVQLKEMLGPVTPESLIPVTLKPDQFLIVIAGGDGKHSHYFPPFLQSFPSSKLVTK